jgi:hypothetical protein
VPDAAIRIDPDTVIARDRGMPDAVWVDTDSLIGHCGMHTVRIHAETLVTIHCQYSGEERYCKKNP